MREPIVFEGNAPANVRDNTLLRALLDAGLLHGDTLTVTGKTMAENLAEIAPPDLDCTIIHAMNNPSMKMGISPRLP